MYFTPAGRKYPGNDPIIANPITTITHTAITTCTTSITVLLLLQKKKTNSNDGSFLKIVSQPYPYTAGALIGKKKYVPRNQDGSPEVIATPGHALLEYYYYYYYMTTTAVALLG